MSVFRFRLEAFLKFKESLEMQEALKYAKSSSRLQEIQKKLNKIEFKFLEAEKNWTKKSAIKSLSPFDALRHYDYLGFLKSEKVIIQNEYQAALLDLEKIKTKLVKARQEKEVLENLKKKQLESYRYTEMSREEKEIEDWVQARRSCKLRI